MSDDTPYTLHRGHRPLLVSVPHAGREIPPTLIDRYLPRALNVEDTDWHLDQLYDFVRELGASLLVPRYSRYVVDLNRDPSGTALYPGADNSEILARRLIEDAGVATTPGIDFGDNAPDRHLRIAYTTGEARLVEAAERIARVLRTG